MRKRRALLVVLGAILLAGAPGEAEARGKHRSHGHHGGHRHHGHHGGHFSFWLGPLWYPYHHETAVIVEERTGYSASFAGDSVPYREYLLRNSENSTELALGMSKSEVMSTMGSASSMVRDGPLANPWKAEAFERGEDTFEVLFYLVRKHPPFTRIRESQAIAVVIKNGSVTGWGVGAHRPLK